MEQTTTRSSEVKRAEKLARRLDEAAFRLARGKPMIEVALGEIFLRLSVENRLIDLGFSNQVDLANEKLGIPPRRWFSLQKLALDLRERPILREAVIAGRVSTEKARLIMPRAIGEEEACFVTAAMEMTVKELKGLVGDGAVEPMADFRTLRFRMTPDQQDRLDAALSLAREMVGYDATRMKLTEAVARAWLSSWKHRGDEPEEENDDDVDLNPEWLQAMKRKKDEVAKQLRAVFEAAQVVEREIDDGETAMGLLAQAKRLLDRLRKFDVPLGRVLLRISETESWRWLGFENFEEYCRERLGFSGRTGRERVRLERRLRELPPLREALESQRITYTKAVVIARVATPADVSDRIAMAAGTTFQQTKREVQAEEDRADRKANRRKVHGTVEQIRVILRAVSSARQFFAVRGEEIDDDEAFARVGDHYFALYERPIRRSDWRKKWEKDVLLRHGGLCAVPGCTREAKHVHHIVPREKNGPDRTWNGLGLCFLHHKRGIHAGRMTVRGRGGEYLVWNVLGESLDPIEVWVTRGADDVRRVSPSGEVLQL